MSQEGLIVQLVRLNSSQYSVRMGTLGVIAEQFHEEEEVAPKAFRVNWIGTPGGPGGASAPVYGEHLEVVGPLFVETPKVAA